MYSSPVDILGITVEEITHLGADGLIRLGKKLKAVRPRQGDQIVDAGQIDALLDRLHDAETKNHVLFVEKHPLLKHFIATGEDAGPKTFFIHVGALDDIPNIGEFLAPYFEVYFMPMVKRDCKERKYKTVIWAMRNRALFTSTLLDIYNEFIISEIRVLVERIKLAKPGELFEYCPEITKKSLIRLMNTVSSNDMLEVKKAYVEAMVAYYNTVQKEDHEFYDLMLSFKYFKNLELNDTALENHLKGLAVQIKPGSHRKLNAIPSKARVSPRRLVRILVVLFFCVSVFGGMFIDYLNEISEPSDLEESHFMEDVEEPFDFDAPESFGGQASDANIYPAVFRERFIKNLINGDPSNAFGRESLTIENGKNPYPSLFMSKKDEGVTGYRVPIFNDSGKDLIVFARHEGANMPHSVYIPSGRNSHVHLHTSNQVLHFYKGDNFYYTPMRVGSAQDVGRPNKYFETTSAWDRQLLKKEYSVNGLGADPVIRVDNSTINFFEIDFTQHRITP